MPRASDGPENIINLRQLRYFSKVVETGNMTRAAEQLYVAQPALGLQIRQLEKELAVSLLVRHSRGVQATSAGRLLYERAQAILRSIEETRLEVMSYAQAAQENLVLGITPGIANVLGSDLLVQARETLPGIHLSLVEEMSYVLVEAIERDDIDLALAYEVAERATLLRTALLDEELLCVVAPQAEFLADALRRAGEIDLSAVLTYPLVLAGERDPARRLIWTESERLGRVFKVDFEASSISMMKSLIATGAAAGIMPRGSVAAELRSGELLAMRIVRPTLRRTLYLVRSSRRQPLQAESAIMHFVSTMIDRFADEQGDLVRRHRLGALGAETD